MFYFDEIGHYQDEVRSFVFVSTIFSGPFLQKTFRAYGVAEPKITKVFVSGTQSQIVLDGFKSLIGQADHVGKSGYMGLNH